MKYQRSFTLLESIVAIYVFLMGIVGAMTLANQSLSAASVFKEQLVATNLAQEGEELVRNMRDTKFLQTLRGVTPCDVFDTPPCDANKEFELSIPAGCATGCRIDDPMAANLSLTACDAVPPGVCKYLKKDLATGYQYLSGLDTKYDRRIFITPSTTRVTGPPLIRDWKVRTVVTWQRRFGSMSYEVNTHFTPWLY